MKSIERKNAKIYGLTILFLSFALIAALFLQGKFKAEYRINPLLYPEGAPSFDKGRQEDPQNVSPYQPAAFRNRALFLFTDIALGLAGSLAIYFILNNAFYLIISAGGEDKIGQYKKGITWAFLGLIFIIVSYSLIRFIITIPFVADEKGRLPIPAAPLSAPAGGSSSGGVSGGGS